MSLSHSHMGVTAVQPERKDLDKEIRVLTTLKHTNVVTLLDKLVIEPDTDPRYISGVYMLMEFAHGGDLFDKIGERFISGLRVTVALTRYSS